MATARKEIVRPNQVQTFHCTSRCVRRAYLCGFDKLLNKSFDHRKEWVRDRLKILSKVFLVDVGTYAIMSNHLHIVLRTRPDKAKNLNRDEILSRWGMIYSKELEKETEEDTNIRIEELRERLSSVSWFMKCISEYIARKANLEDDCKGRFWEGRFKCQLLIGEASKIACMAYVDLNPIRARLNEKLEESDFTGIQERIESLKSKMRLEEIKKKEERKLNEIQLRKINLEIETIENRSWLSPIGGTKIQDKNFISIEAKEYIELVEWTGRKIKEGKRGRISNSIEDTISRLDVSNQKWLRMVEGYGSIFYRILGKAEDVIYFAESAKRRWFWGIRQIRELTNI